MDESKEIEFKPADLRIDACQTILIKELNIYTTKKIDRLAKAVRIANLAIARAIEDSKQ